MTSEEEDIKALANALIAVDEALEKIFAEVCAQSLLISLLVEKVSEKDPKFSTEALAHIDTVLGRWAAHGRPATSVTIKVREKFVGLLRKPPDITGSAADLSNVTKETTALRSRFSKWLKRDT